MSFLIITIFLIGLPVEFIIETDNPDDPFEITNFEIINLRMMKLMESL